MRKNGFVVRLLSGASMGAVVAGAVLLIDGVSNAALPPGTPQGSAAAQTPTKTTTKLEVFPPSPVTYGTLVKLTATINPTTATGAVQFQDGTTPLGSPMPVSNGTASTSTSALTSGKHSLTAVFTPSDSNLTTTSTSDPVIFEVNPATGAATTRQTTILTQSTASIDLLPLPEVRLAAKLIEANGKPIAGRMIDFYGGKQLLCHQTTDTNGWARCSGAENFGLQTVEEAVAGYEAVFSGDENFEPATQHASATIGTSRSHP